MTDHPLISAFGAVSVVIAIALAASCSSGTGVEIYVPIDDDDIGGTVTSSNGPEAGVWVIAETTDLPTKYAKIVATDDAGRYVLPDLPEATYDIFVRGYGLVDSAKVQASPGAALDLSAVVAPDEASAAQYYPANYWFAMLEPPPSSDFPGTGDDGNGIPEQQGAAAGDNVPGAVSAPSGPRAIRSLSVSPS